MTEVFSVTGERIVLKDASFDALVEVYDALEAEHSIVQERLALVGREIMKRMSGHVELTKEFTVTVKPRVYVSRRRES